MRSTFDLPDDLVKQAKLTAIKRGVPLRDLVAEGLRKVLARPDSPRARTKLPNIRIAEDAPVRYLTPAGIKKLEAEQEAEHLDAVHRPR